MRDRKKKKGEGVDYVNLDEWRSSSFLFFYFLREIKWQVAQKQDGYGSDKGKTHDFALQGFNTTLIFTLGLVK